MNLRRYEIDYDKVSQNKNISYNILDPNKRHVVNIKALYFCYDNSLEYSDGLLLILSRDISVNHVISFRWRCLTNMCVKSRNKFPTVGKAIKQFNKRKTITNKIHFFKCMNHKQIQDLLIHINEGCYDES